MNDPHVEALYYKRKPDAGTVYNNPSRVDISQPTFKGELYNGASVSPNRAILARGDQILLHFGIVVIKWLQ
jgi:hypothetical protein